MPQEAPPKWVYVELPGYGLFKVDVDHAIMIRRALDLMEEDPPKNRDAIIRRIAEGANLTDLSIEDGSYVDYGDTTLESNLEEGTITQAEANRIRMELERDTARLKKIKGVDEGSPFERLVLAGRAERRDERMAEAPREEVPPTQLASSAETVAPSRDTVATPQARESSYDITQDVARLEGRLEAETLAPPSDTVATPQERELERTVVPESVAQLPLESTTETPQIAPETVPTPPVSPPSAPTPGVPPLALANAAEAVPVEVSTTPVPEPPPLTREEELTGFVETARRLDEEEVAALLEQQEAERGRPIAEPVRLSDRTEELLDLADKAYPDEKMVRYYLGQIDEPPPYGDNPLNLQSWARSTDDMTDEEARQYRAAQERLYHERIARQNAKPQQRPAPSRIEAPVEQLTDEERLAQVELGAVRRDRRPLSGADLQRVSQEVFPQAHIPEFDRMVETLAASRRGSQAAQYPTRQESGGDSFNRGWNEGLMHSLQLFGADLEHDPVMLREGLPMVRERLLPQAIGSFIGMTPGFLAASALGGVGMGAVGLRAATMTPLAFNLTRAGVGGALLGAGATRPDELHKLPLNMTKEAGLWMIFEYGLLGLTGKAATMMEQGRQIKGVRRQLGGTTRPGDFTVPPTYLDIERILNPNMAETTREAANRIVTAFRLDPKNPYAGVAATFTQGSRKYGTMTFDAATKEEAESLVKGLKALKQEGIHFARHENTIAVVQPQFLPQRSVRFDGTNTWWFMDAPYGERSFALRGLDGELSDQSIINLIRRGLANEVGAPPLEIELVESTLVKGAQAEYKFTFGGKGILGERKIYLVVNPKASDREILSALAHEATHDMLVMALGRNPQRKGLLNELLGIRKSKKSISVTEARAELTEMSIRAIQRRNGISRKAAEKIFRDTPALQDDFEMLASLTELMTANLKRAKSVAPKMTALWEEYILRNSPLLRSATTGERIMSERSAAGFLEVLEGKVKAGLQNNKGWEAIRSFNTSYSKLSLRQAEYSDDLLRQFEREGVFDGMSVWYNGARYDAQGIAKNGRVIINETVGSKFRGKVTKSRNVAKENLQFPTLQNMIKLDKDMHTLARKIVESGKPHLLGVTVVDNGVLRRLIFRTNDLLEIPKGTSLAEWITSKRPKINVEGKVNSELERIAAGIAEEEGHYAGILIRDELGARILSNRPKEQTLHHFQTSPEAVHHQDIRASGWDVSGEDVIAQALYQNGVPLIEAERMAQTLFAEDLKQIWPKLGEEFTKGYDETLKIWDDINKELELLNLGGADDATRTGLLYEQLDDGTVLLRDRMHRHVGKFASGREAKEFVAKLDPSTAPRFTSRVTGVPDATTAGLGAMGGAGPPRPFANVDDLATSHSTLWSDMLIDELKFAAEGPSEAAHVLFSRTPDRILGIKDRVLTFFTAMKPVAQSYEKAGYGPAYRMIYEPLQKAMDKVKFQLSDKAVFGGKSYVDMIHDYRLSMYNIEAGRRSLITELAMRPTRKIFGPNSIIGRELNQSELALIGALEKRGLGDDLPLIFSEFLNYQRYARQNEKYLLGLRAEAAGLPTQQRQFNQAVLGMGDDEIRAFTKMSELERTLKLAELGGVSKEARDIMAVLSKVTDPKSKIDINMLGVSRHFSTQRVQSRADFIRANGMTAAEIKAADDMMLILEKAFPSGRDGADRFIQGVFPEAARWAKRGIEMSEPMVKQFFGDDALFLHHKMTQASIGPYLRDPVTLTYRTVRGRMMEDFFDPVYDDVAKPALDAMANFAMGKPPGLERAQVERAWRNMTNYARELQGTPHNSFIVLNEKVAGIFQHMGIDVPPDIAQDYIQKLTQLTYKAFIPMRPLLLIRNLSEVIRLGGTVGGQDLGYGIRHVMKNRKQALEEAIKGGAIRPDSPLFPVDNAAMLSGNVAGMSGKQADRFLRFSQKTASKINDVTEIGMGWYQDVDQLTRAVAYHAMKKRVTRHMDLAHRDFGKFLEKAKINTFDETEVTRFAEIWKTDKNAAVDYISSMFADNSLFLYGSANHPVGWGSAWGVMFGQFGTWPIQYAQWMARGALRGSRADRIQFLAWNVGAMGGIMGVGAKMGLDLRSYWGVPSLAYTGGPYLDFTMDLATAVTGNERERAMAIASLKSTGSVAPADWPTMFIPLSAAAADARDALLNYDGIAQGLLHEMVVPQLTE